MYITKLLLPFVIAGIITGIRIKRLHDHGKLKNLPAALIGHFIAVVAACHLILELILKDSTPEGVIVAVIVFAIAAAVYRFAGLRRKSELNNPEGA